MAQHAHSDEVSIDQTEEEEPSPATTTDVGSSVGQEYIGEIVRTPTNSGRQKNHGWRCRFQRKLRDLEDGMWLKVDLVVDFMHY